MRLPKIRIFFSIFFFLLVFNNAYSTNDTYRFDWSPNGDYLAMSVSKVSNYDGIRIYSFDRSTNSWR